MIYLKKDTVNKLVLVTDDMQINENEFYLWRFVNNTTHEEYLIHLENQLKNNQRADKFSLDLPNDLNLESGKYRYYVYASPTDSDEDYESMNLLTENAMEVVTEFAKDTNYERTGEDKVYRGFNS